MRRSCVSDRIVHEPDRFARMFPRLGPQLPHDFGQCEQSSRTPDSGIAETTAQMLRDRRARTAPTIPFGFLYGALLLLPGIGFIFRAGLRGGIGKRRLLRSIKQPEKFST